MYTFGRAMRHYGWLASRLFVRDRARQFREPVQNRPHFLSGRVRVSWPHHDEAIADRCHVIRLRAVNADIGDTAEERLRPAGYERRTRIERHSEKLVVVQ